MAEFTPDFTVVQQALTQARAQLGRHKCKSESGVSVTYLQPTQATPPAAPTSQPNSAGSNKGITMNSVKSVRTFAVDRDCRCTGLRHEPLPQRRFEWFSWRISMSVYVFILLGLIAFALLFWLWRLYVAAWSHCQPIQRLA